ncbi:tRNA (guanine-N(7)-)-methyltransferase [Gloeomargarita lithophora Alchichica-D10]|uniref:tRNA (guanine-N(7)-)-methyltransferase n=1 Tax=Gloeomargarita lithophora Alchichica-D10 TaxID=1188229 RepID=A0A1J0AHD4_9CYAN|nr:tRNA (guanosine(46)-N7)-methyltransferase TrmB [Gloeomargarita lithophora]APB35335.1 tRNA (guanine-N(7)-)-methyltransferase [Gloeomargarita lithophora Alchichica-D10]
MRVRQHVNPLSQQFLQPLQLPDWRLIYAQINQPLHLDIGCARGRFLFTMAEQSPDWNFLGLEIREPLVHQANTLKIQHNLGNTYFLMAQANVHLESILASFPVGILERVTIQFPDPWFKRKQQKRRLVQPDLVATIANYLRPGGEVFLQSDIWDVALDMYYHFQGHTQLQVKAEMLSINPFGVPTEREQFVLKKGLPVYRFLLQRSRD